jgi:hypothetical protein
MLALTAAVLLWTCSYPAAAANSPVSPSAVSGAQIWALVEALRLAAPRTGIEPDGLYGEWQVKADNVTRWSRRCLGRALTPAEFEARPTVAREVVVCVMGPVLREQYGQSLGDKAVAVRRAAAWWMAGDPEQYDRGPTAACTQKVLDFYRQQFP